MKIISTVHAPRDLNTLLDLDLRRVYTELGYGDSPPITWLSLEEKAAHLREVEGWLSRLWRDEAARARSEEDARPIVEKFTRFMDLPSELRFKIWSHAIAPSRQPRVHAIVASSVDEYGNPTAFISNQPISPLPHVNCEAQTHYLFLTSSVFAFGTYVSYTRDIFYHPKQRHGDDSLSHFLSFTDSAPIRHLAMTYRQFYNLETRGHDRYRGHREVMERLEVLEEILMVFRDGREVPGMEAYGECERGLEWRRFTARELRKGNPRGPAANYVKLVRQAVGDFVDVRYGVLEEGED